MTEKQKRPRKMANSAIFNNRVVEWIQSDWFCPKCGRDGMWQEGKGGADYYHDNSVTCFDCGYSMCCVESVEDDK